MIIASRAQLEGAALHFGLLPFFRNGIPGFSVEEMSAPGMLFGETSQDEGCWEWKGPVIREQTTAYGKFFNRKAGFVALELLQDFLNYRRNAYPLKRDSTEEMILGIIREHEGLLSTELKRIIFGASPHKRKPEDLAGFMEPVVKKRHSLEGPLQRLQMGGHLLIADFEYKYTAKGERYGWGVALYSTPEIWFERDFKESSRTPQESFEFLVETLAERLPGVSRTEIGNIIR